MVNGLGSLAGSLERWPNLKRAGKMSHNNKEATHSPDLAWRERVKDERRGGRKRKKEVKVMKVVKSHQET